MVNNLLEFFVFGGICLILFLVILGFLIGNDKNKPERN
jgi:hypothetical protein